VLCSAACAVLCAAATATASASTAASCLTRLRASFHPSQPSSSTSSSAAYYTPSQLSTQIGVILLPGQVPCTPDCHLSGAVYETTPSCSPISYHLTPTSRTLFSICPSVLHFVASKCRSVSTSISLNTFGTQVPDPTCIHSAYQPWTTR
jgi:hypothetical protein